MYSTYYFQRIWCPIPCSSFHWLQNLCWLVVLCSRWQIWKPHHKPPGGPTSVARLYCISLWYWDYQAAPQVPRCKYRPNYDDILHDWWPGEWNENLKKTRYSIHRKLRIVYDTWDCNLRHIIPQGFWQVRILRCPGPPEVKVLGFVPKSLSPRSWTTFMIYISPWICFFWYYSAWFFFQLNLKWLIDALYIKY